MNKLNKFGYTKVELLIIIVLLGIVAFVTINKTSYAFAMDNGMAIKDIKNLIEIQAVDFARDNLGLFNESDITYVSVNDLVQKGYLIANSDGYVTNPANVKEYLNNNKVKLEYVRNNNTIEATLVY